MPKPAGGNNFGFGPGGFKLPDAAPADEADKPDKPDKEKKPAPPKGDAAVQLPGTCVVRGTLRSFKGGKLVLKLDRGVVKAVVGDDAQINIDTTDLSFARVGDKISVRGQRARGVLAADSVTVEGAEPLTGLKKKPIAGAKKKSPAKKDDAADDSGDVKP